MQGLCRYVYFNYDVTGSSCRFMNVFNFLFCSHLTNHLQEKLELVCANISQKSVAALLLIAIVQWMRTIEQWKN